MRIGQREVGQGAPPFVIAEMSGNHNQSLSRALEIVDAAGACGVDALKIQTYTADTMTLALTSGEFVINDPASPWAGRTLHDLYAVAHTPWEWHEPIMRRARELGMVCFSTPFDESAVDFLEELDVPCYKIASFENNHIPLIRRVAKTGKPIIISTGMARLGDIQLAVDTARAAGCKDLVLLKCTSTYPAAPASTNIRTIPHLRESFQCEVGLSDHTMGLGVAVAAVTLGATVVEKHFTLRRADGGVDSAFSLEPEEMSQLVVELNRATQSLGHVQYGATEAERGSLMFKRSLYVVEDVAAGDELTAKNIRCIRPGFGLAPKHYDAVIGKRARGDLARGTALQWDLID